jgi:molybdenum cofactor synthesis domain-containing protein
METQAGRIKALCTSERKGERKKPQRIAHFIVEHGIEGDAHAGPWHRQVSLLAEEDVQTIREGGLPNVAHGDFAENVVVSGVPLHTLGLGSRLRLGDHVLLSVTQIGKVCHTRCRVYEITGDCIMPRLGLFARVVQGGAVRVGNAVSVEHAVPRDAYQTVVLTISDRCSRGEAEDTAGPAVARLVEKKLGAHTYRIEVLPDEREAVSERLKHYCGGHSIDLVLTVGGTGFSPRDVTPEATRAVVERLTPGLDEAMRAASLASTPHAMLSRSVSGVRGSTLIVNLPGSERGAVENLSVILRALPHGLEKLRGDPSDCGR